MSKKIEDIILLGALQNAIKFKGKANPKALIGGIIKEKPDAKNDMKNLMVQINKIVDEVNSLSLEKQEKKLLELNPDFHKDQESAKAQRKKERQELPPLKNAEIGKVITRIPPEPSKYNHLGHALSFLINYLYAKKYEGSTVLRFEDTNPEKESEEFVEAMEKDVLEYLDIKPDKIIFVSDHMPKYYECAESLINRDLAFTCSCPSSKISKLRREMQGCSCRDKSKEKVLEEWKKMIDGELDNTTLRLRIAVDHKNAVMRDPVILRVIDAPHYRQGTEYKVWPMYDFENALEDSWCGVTHVMRSNEFETRIELHNYIKDLFNLPKQEVMQYGRFNIVGSTTQGREIRAMIESGEAIGWDDPKLVTLRALKRRGILPEAFYELAKKCGMSKTQTNLDFDVLAAINRRILDEDANRYFFVEKPIKIKIENWPSDLNNVELKLHPHKNRGGRPLKLDGTFYIAKKDYDKIVKQNEQKNCMFRLIDTANIIFENDKFKFHSKTIDEFKNFKDNKFGLIHFLPCNEKLIEASIYMPDNSTREGLCEPTIAELKENSIVQFERECFVRLDAIDNVKFKFWFTHK